MLLIIVCDSLDDGVVAARSRGFPNIVKTQDLGSPDLMLWVTCKLLKRVNVCIVTSSRNTVDADYFQILCKEVGSSYGRAILTDPLRN